MGDCEDKAVSVRLCEHRDIGAITRVLNTAIETGWAHFATDPVTDLEIGTRWERSRAAYPWLIAEIEEGSDHAFAGFAKASAWKSRGAYRWTVEIGVYVEQCAQGRGIGKRLYRALFEILSAQGFSIALAGVALPNAASERLHEAVGMIAAGEISPAGYKLGAWRPVRYYTKTLNPTVDAVEPEQPKAVSEILASICFEPEA